MDIVKTVTVKLKGDTSNLENATKAAKNNIKSNISSMAKAVGALGIAYAGVATAIKATSIAKDTFINMTNVAAGFETLKTTLINIEGSSQRANESLKWIEDFSAKTPFQIEQVTQGFMSLKAYGIDPVEGVLRSLGDTASAMGKPLAQAVEAMADAVVGENERLKEFGIRASSMGEQIRYTWTNASGEARAAIVQNNSAIIQSTLTSIFNSKYAGAMQMQAQTWNGLLSNMQDNWRKAQKNIMDAGLFDYMKAIVMVVGEYLNKGFDKAVGGAKTFANYTIETIKTIIRGFGGMYDTIEGIGDTLELLKNLFLLGIGVPTGAILNLVGYVERSFMDMANRVIDTINFLAGAANNLPGVNIPMIGKISYDSSPFQRYLNEYNQGLQTLSQNTKKAWDDLLTPGGGANFAQKFLKDIDIAYEKIKEVPKISSEKIDFGDTLENIEKAKTNKKEELKEYKNEGLKEYEEYLDKFNKDLEAAFKVKGSVNLDKEPAQIKPDDIKVKPGKTFTVDVPAKSFQKDIEATSKTIKKLKPPVVKTTKEADKAKIAIDNLGKAYENATKSMQSFTFKFKDSFINALESSKDALGNIFKTSSKTATLNYQDAYELVKQAQQKLINNPLDVKIGKEYEAAYQAFTNASDNFLSDESKFQNKSDFLFASATIGTQTNQLQNTAQKAYNVLENMKDLLDAINKAMEDGVLTNEEKSTIAGVADRVNVSNTKLLGSDGLVRTISNQTYYDPSGAKDVSLVGSSNSVTSYLNSLNQYGRGITIGSIGSGVGTLSVNTGLDPNQIAEIKTNTSNINNSAQAAKIATQNTKISTDNVKTSVDTMAGGKSLANLQIKEIRRNYIYKWLVGGPMGASGTGAYPPSNAFGTSIVSATGEQYFYYAKGGFTKAIGKKDYTGEKVAGIVHEGEWIAPRRMVEKNRAFFEELEGIRLSGYAKGGFTSRSPLQSISENKTDKQILNELTQLNRLLRTLSDNGDALRCKNENS